MTQPEPLAESEGLSQAATAALITAFSALVLAELTSWLAEVKDALLSGVAGVFNLTAFGALSDSWDRRVDRMIPDLMRAARAGWEETASQLGLRIPFDPTDPILVEQLNRTRNLLVRIDEEVYRMVIKAIADGTDRGETPTQIAARIDNVLSITGSENWPNRADVIARTECLPGDAVIDGASVTHVYRRWYEGDLFTVTTEQGHRFSGTPNHPVLTIFGWKGVGDLQEGDELLRHQGSVKASSPSADEDVEARPATIGEIFDSLQAVSVFGRIRGGEPDFHGDGAEGDVDILTANSVLRYGIVSHTFQYVEEVGLEGASLCGCPLGCPGCLGNSTTPVAHGFRWTSQLDSGKFENFRHGLTAAPDLRGHFILADSGQVQVDHRPVGDFGNGGPLAEMLDVGSSPDNAAPLHLPVDESDGDAIPPGDGRYGVTAEIVADKVVHVDKIVFSGHVYNLSTVDGYFYSQGGFVTRNCTRFTEAGALSAAQRWQTRTGRRLDKQWVDRDDSRVRSSHREVDGDRVALGSLFEVNGSLLRYPGDPSGLPHDVINCRCHLKFVEVTP